jgi:hypothetical protein
MRRRLGTGGRAETRNPHFAYGKFTMKTAIAILSTSAFLLSAFASASFALAPSGGSAGSKGRLYCQTLPKDLNERDNWNRLCSGRR